MCIGAKKHEQDGNKTKGRGQENGGRGFGCRLIARDCTRIKHGDTCQWVVLLFIIITVCLMPKLTLLLIHPSLLSTLRMIRGQKKRRLLTITAINQENEYTRVLGENATTKGRGVVRLPASKSLWRAASVYYDSPAIMVVVPPLLPSLALLFLFTSWCGIDHIVALFGDGQYYPIHVLSHLQLTT